MKKDKSITKLVIPAAGVGSRFLPVTKNIPKEMLPVVNVPTIHYIIKEAVESGIKEVLIIISSNKEAIVQYFRKSTTLIKLLNKNKKHEEAKELELIPKLAKISFVKQKHPNGLGDAIKLAKKFTKNDPFCIILGDDLVFNKKNEKPALKQCIDLFDKHNATVLGVQKVEKNNISKYGIVEILKSNFRVKSIVEKPSIAEAPSNIAIMGRYVFTSKIYDELNKVQFDKSGEIQLTDAIVGLVKNKTPVYACNFKGKRFDIGSKLGFIQANIHKGLEDKSISKDLLNFIKKTI